MEKYNSNGTVGSTDLMSGVKYFDKDGKEVTMDADKGTKVAYAEISYSGLLPVISLISPQIRLPMPTLP